MSRHHSSNPELGTDERRLILRLTAEASRHLDEADDLASFDFEAHVDVETELRDDLEALQLALRDVGATTRRFIPRASTQGNPQMLRRLETGALRSEDQSIRQRRIARAGASLTQYWFVELGTPGDPDGLNVGETEARKLIDLLGQVRVVEWVLREPDVSNPAVQHADPYYDQQTYLEPAPTGIGVEAAWDEDLDGENISLVDVEQGWNIDHQDLPAGIVQLYGLNDGNQEHGTEVLGILAARDDAQGICGIAPELKRLATSSRYSAVSKRDVSGALIEAINELPTVLLVEIELYFSMPDGVSRRYPIELLPPYWLLLYIATMLGITVVEPAGNGALGRGKADLDLLGGLNLDKAADDAELADYVANVDIAWAPTADDGTPAGWGLMPLDPDAVGFVDSGAILVGACEPGIEPGENGHRAVNRVDDKNQGRSWGSNYGKRVNCHAWGADVVTTSTHHDLNAAQGVLPTEAYTGSFDGTSSASAIIAGVTVLVQQLFLERTGKVAAPEDLRRVLENNGTPYAGARPIGVMPDLAKVVNSLQALGPPGQDVA